MIMTDPLGSLVNQEVVLDTATPIVYVGTLAEVTDQVFVLCDADMHDCRDGHADKELYLRESREHGVAANRQRVVVLRSAVISVSRLADVVAD
jgi:hypothetical protein